MKLVASSNPSDVDRCEAIGLLVQRAVLTRMVCQELIDRTNNEFNCRWRADTALGFLMEWISLLTGSEEVFSATDGIDLMSIPDDCLHLIDEIRDGARVCDALAMFQSADTKSDVMNDTIHLKKQLNTYWKKHSSVALPPSVFLE